MATGSPASLRHALLGRDAELEELVAALEDARLGRGGLVVISGEGGVGKTRLVEALEARIGPTEVRTLWGRCWEGGGAPPFWPFVQVLRGLVDGMSPAGLHRLLGEGAPDLARLVPELTRTLPDITPRPASDAPDARLRLFDAVGGVLTRAAAASGGLIVAIDDLHSADEGSLLLLRTITSELPASHVLIVGTYRDAEAVSRPRTQRLLDAIGRVGRRLPLAGLDGQAVTALLEQETGELASKGLGREVHLATNGNPLFVKEVARLLAVEPQRRVAGSGAPIPLPEELRATLSRRIEALPPDSVAVLGLASVLGREFDLPVLARLAGVAPADVLDALDSVRSAGVVGEVAVGRWSFDHALVREAVYETLSPSERAEAHRRAGEVLEEEELAGGGSPERLAEIAHHLYSARLGDVSKAVRYLDAAAHQAADALAFEEAAVLWARALDCVALSQPVDEVRRTEILIGLTDALHRAGDYLRAREAYHRTLKAARATGSPVLIARAAVSLPLKVYGRVDSARLRAMEEAFTVVHEVDGVLRCLVMIELAAAVTMRARAEDHPSWKEGWRGWQSSEERSLDLLAGALALARREADSNDSRQVLLRWLTIANIFEQPVDDGSVAEELLRRFGDAGDAEGAALARFFVIRRLMVEGRVAAMRAQLDLFERQAQELRLPHLWLSAVSARAALAVLEGGLDEAVRLAHEAHSIGERLEVHEAELHLQRRMEVILTLKGRFREVEELAWRKVRHMPPAMKIECSRVALATALVERSETAEEGRALFLDMVPCGLEPDVFGAPRSCCLVGLADVGWLLGEPTGAAELYDLLLPYRGQVAVRGMSTPRGVFERYLGQLAALLARYDEAEAHFEEAHRRHEKLGAKVWLALGWTDHARMLRARAGAGDEGRARDLLGRARVVFAELGLDYHEQRARTLLHGAGKGGGRSCFLQEGEYWTVVHDGQEIRLRDGKGARYLARLLRQPRREMHVLDLLVGGTGEGPVMSSGLEELSVSGGDAGPMLDAAAKTAYRRRLGDLEGDLEEARGRSDISRIEKAEAERDFLVAQLAEAVGLAGRDRPSASQAERARQSVTRAIRSTIERIGGDHPALGNHLTATVRTGAFCVYEPDPQAPVTWET